MTGRAISHYRVLEKLGEGGMGAVYKARDTRLDRLVALKFLPPERVADPDRKRRFMREARSASALNHPNIVTIYDIGQAGGVDFIAMEYVDGRTLNQAIAGQPLPVEEVLCYAGQIADALAAAHRDGIIHRDLKPSNIMVTGDGRVKILDFGLAKLSGHLPAGTESTLTQVAGTPAYMPPEQAGGRAVDARSDIYTLGAVLYEMLTGRRAFEGFLREEPPPLEGAPPGLRQIVARCLRRDPAERFQTAAELKTALEDTAQKPGQAPSIAVLPFLNLSRDKEDEYFSEGLAEEIINALTKLPGLRVAARTSSFAFRGKEMDVREIGTKLQVGRILEGSVRRAGNRIRITVQLVGAADGYHLWSERYDREMADVFDIQEEIAQAIAGKLRVQIVGGQPLIARHTANLEAYNLYLEGRYWWRQATRESWAKAVERFERAIAAEPGYAPPYAGLAVAYTYLSIHGWARPREVMPVAKQHALKALALEETLAEAHWALAYVHQWFEWNWRAAEREYRRAVALNAGDAHFRMVFSCFLLFIGRTEEALAGGQQAADLDPVSEEVCRLAIYLDWLAGRFDEAAARGRKGIELHPHSAGIHGALGLALALGGRLGEAVAALRKAGELAAGDPFYACCLGYVYALQERRAEAAAIAGELEMRRRGAFFSPTWLAILYGALGDLERAFELLECALEERDSFLVAARADPVFDPLRGSPRFTALLERLGFEA